MEDEDSPMICAMADEGAIPNRAPGFGRVPGFERKRAIDHSMKSDIDVLQLVAQATRGSMVDGMSRVYLVGGRGCG